MFLLHIPRLLLPLLTGSPFSNNWYVSTGGFPSAEQLKVTTEPWHTVDLLTVKLKFSGLSARLKSEMECYYSLHCKCHSEFSTIVQQNVLLYKLQIFTTIFSHRWVRISLLMWTSIYQVEHLKRNSASSIIFYSISNAVKQCKLPSTSYSINFKISLRKVRGIPHSSRI